MALREFVSKPPLGSVRLHCTMIRHDDDNNLSSGTCYTLYLEYLGGLVPLLKGKRTSKIRPEFVIFDPQVEGKTYSTFIVGLKNNFQIKSVLFLNQTVKYGSKHESGAIFDQHNFESL